MKILVNILVFILLFSCSSKEGSKYLSNFKNNAIAKKEIEDYVRKEKGIMIDLYMKESKYGTMGKLADEEFIIIPFKTKIKPYISSEIYVEITPNEEVKKEILYKSKSNKWDGFLMRKVPSKARKYSLNEFENNNNSIDNIGGRVLGGLFRERYGNLYNKFIDLNININGETIIFDKEESVYYSDFDQYGNVKFSQSLDENLKKNFLEKYILNRFGNLTNIEIESVLDENIEDMMTECKNAKNNFCPYYKSYGKVKYYNASFHFKYKNTKDVKKIEVKELVRTLMEKINYDFPERYACYFTLYYDKYNSEHVLFYLENKSIKYVEHVPVVKD